MNLYITLQEETNIEEQMDKLSQALKCHEYKVLGQYNSRGYTTIVVKFEGNITDEKILDIETQLKERLNLLEVGRHMKFYIVLGNGCKSSLVNQKVRNLLEQKGYDAETYNSHSENGNMYVGLKIRNINPMNKEELQTIEDILIEVNGIERVIIY